MAIRKISEFNITLLQKKFRAQLEEDGHTLTEFDLTESDSLLKLSFEIDGYYKHSFQWPASDIIGKEFIEIVQEVFKAFDQDRHMERNGN